MPAAQHFNKDRAPALVGTDDLAVEDGVRDAEALRQRGGERVEMLEVIAVARDEARAGSVDFEERAEAVVLLIRTGNRDCRKRRPVVSRQGARSTEDWLSQSGAWERARSMSLEDAKASARGVRSARGGAWYAATVLNLLAREVKRSAWRGSTDSSSSKGSFLLRVPDIFR
jgi:hypothetical protein